MTNQDAVKQKLLKRFHELIEELNAAEYGSFAQVVEHLAEVFAACP